LEGFLVAAPAVADVHGMKLWFAEWLGNQIGTFRPDG
jgi:hypothetical protein